MVIYVCLRSWYYIEIFIGVLNKRKLSYIKVLWIGHWFNNNPIVKTKQNLRQSYSLFEFVEIMWNKQRCKYWIIKQTQIGNIGFN